MTAPLELRYRRLLAIYPAAHREAYEEEMVEVLMAGARPGQRRPALAEAVDLVRSGMVARLGRGARDLRTAGWRDAAAVVALIGVVMLAAVACRRLIFGLQYARQSGDPMRAFGVDGGLLADVAVRSGAWLAVLVAVLLAARRTAVALGVVALVVELAAIVVWLPGQEFRAIEMSWVLALASLTLALLVLSRSAVAATAVLLAGLVRISPASRRRTLVLLAPVLAVPVAQQVLERAIDIGFARSVTPGIVVADVLIMVGTPLVAFAGAVVLLHLRENVTVSVTLTRAKKAA